MSDEKNQNPEKEIVHDKFLGGMYDFPLEEELATMELMGEIGPAWRGNMGDYKDAMNYGLEMTKQFQPSPDIMERANQFLKQMNKSEALSGKISIYGAPIGEGFRDIIEEAFYDLCKMFLNLDRHEVNKRIDKIHNATSTKEEEEAGVDEIYAVWRAMISGINAKLKFTTETVEWSVLEINQK